MNTNTSTDDSQERLEIQRLISRNEHVIEWYKNNNRTGYPAGTYFQSERHREMVAVETSNAILKFILSTTK